MIGDVLRMVADRIEDGLFACLDAAVPGSHCCETGCVECEARALRRLADMVDEEGAKACEACREEMAGRLMPEGMEWPRFDTGEPVCVGDKLMTSDGAVRVEELSLTVCDTDGGVTCVPFGERVKRPAPKVLDADGVEVRVGDKLYDTETGCARIVRAINANGTVEFEGHEDRGWFTRFLTHRAPALAADDEPLDVGQTVWDVESGTEYEVVSIYIDEKNPVRVMRTDGSHLAKATKPDTLTHQRPVLDADRSRIEPPMDVWWVCEGDEFGIHAERLHVDGIDGDGMVECSPYNGGTSVVLKPSELYVKRPALDADGVPIKKGDTVFRAIDGREFEVTGIGGAFTIRVKDESMEKGVWTTPVGFTHAKPEIDSWERIEEDATISPREYYARYVGHDVGLKDDEEVNGTFGKSLVRRCRALAEKENKK